VALYPNLRLGPESIRNRGRLQRRVREAFATLGNELTSTDIYNHVFADKQHRRRAQWSRHSVKAYLARIATSADRAWGSPGAPLIWRKRVPE
jgi:hypothetical protein